MRERLHLILIIALLILVFFQQHLIEGYINIIDKQDKVIDELINVISLPGDQNEKDSYPQEEEKKGQDAIIKENKNKEEQEKDNQRPIIRRRGQSFV